MVPYNISCTVVLPGHNKESSVLMRSDEIKRSNGLVTMKSLDVDREVTVLSDEVCIELTIILNDVV